MIYDFLKKTAPWKGGTTGLVIRRNPEQALGLYNVTTGAAESYAQRQKIRLISLRKPAGSSERIKAIGSISS